MAETAQRQPQTSGQTVGIVLVNYNGQKFMPDCLESLATIDYTPARIVVVDNASTDGSADWTAAHYPNIILLRLESNTGITGGNNAGMEWCLQNGCDFVLLLNNDTVVQPDFLSRLMENAAPGRMVVPKIYFDDDRKRINNHFGDFDYWRMVHRDWFYRKLDSPASHRIQAAPMANTCALLVPRAVLEKIGRMDDQLFIYWDDTDFITRAVRVGTEILLVPTAVIYHKESSSSGGSNSPLVVYYTTRNRLYFTFKHQKSRMALAFFLLYFSLTRLLVGAKYLRGGEKAQMAALKNAIMDFFRGHMGKASPQRYGS